MVQEGCHFPDGWRESERRLIPTVADGLEWSYGRGATAAQRLRFVLDLAYGTGLRASELVGTTSGQIEMDERNDHWLHVVDVACRGDELPDSSLIARKLGVGEFALAASTAYLQARLPGQAPGLSGDCIRMSKVGAKTTCHLDGPDGAADVVVNGRVRASTA